MNRKLFVLTLTLVLLGAPSVQWGQQKKPAPPPPKPAAKPFSLPQIPTPPKNSGGILDGMEPKLAETALSHVLNEQLPLKLDADAVYPTVDTIPGGAFIPHPLQLTAADLDRPLPPGDYAIPMLAFCTEYSVHRPGAGLAYRLGPLQGKAAGAIGALLWRGTLERSKPPQQLQAVSWAIQSGLRYSQMPKTYQALIDEVIPDHRNELSGDFLQSLEDSYSGYAKSAKLPPLDQMFAKMGKPGELALSARKQRDALLRQNTTDQVREQTLFAGQETGVYKPVRAEEGPWTERIPGVAYLRYKIVGGNMAANNVMEVRILGRGAVVAQRQRSPRLIDARYPVDSQVRLLLAAMPDSAGDGSTSPRNLTGNSIGCAVGQGAQCLIPVPSVTNKSAGSGNSIAKATSLEGNVTITHNGVTKPLTPNDPIYQDDVITTAANSQAQLSFVDDTQLSMGAGTSLRLDQYVFDPNNTPNNQASYSLLSGAFNYVSGLIAKKPDPDIKIDTPVGTIGIRGTELIAEAETPGIVSIHLIHGAISFTPKGGSTATAFNAPITVTYGQAGIQVLPLSQGQYDAMKAQLFSAKPSVAGGRVIPMPPRKTK